MLDSGQTYNNGYYEWEVISVDSIFIGESWRLRIRFDPDQRMSWIAGIGSTSGLFGTLLNVNVLCLDELDCFFENGKLIYGNCVMETTDIKTFEKCSIHPNPAKDFITIHSNADNEKISIYDLTGCLIIEKKHFNGILDINQLNPGLYCCCIDFANGHSENAKFLVK